LVSVFWTIVSGADAAAACQCQLDTWGMLDLYTSRCYRSQAVVETLVEEAVAAPQAASRTKSSQLPVGRQARLPFAPFSALNVLQPYICLWLTDL
jgi:hypothetical protein